MAEKIVKDVSDFLFDCSEVLGLQARDTFSQGVWCQYADLNIQSPIEQLFYTAFLALAGLSSVPDGDVYRVDGTDCVFGLAVHPQCSIEKYRVDFHITWYGYLFNISKTNQLIRQVIVECDSQEWHERSERERRYEKKRDRDLMRLGHHVFRFTGKEIKEAPFAVALEVLNYVTGEDHTDVLSYMNDLKESVGMRCRTSI